MSLSLSRDPKAHGWFWSASRIVLVSFTSFVLFGALILSLPISHQGAPHVWVDDLFTAASAVCVTGLASIDPGSSYSLFGEIVIMLLIQIGGLGYMTLFTVSMVLIGKRISMRDRLNIQEATDQPGMTGLVKFIMNIIRFTLAVEGLGALLLCFTTVPEFGPVKGAYLALFHAVSAFNNAGFSLFRENAVHWQLQGWPLLVIAGLVILGGLGYNVNHELVRRYLFRQKRQMRWSILLGIVLTMTGILLALGTGCVWLFEHTNTLTLAPLPPLHQWTNAFFMGAMPRTAGFNSINVGQMRAPTLLVTIALMFVGGGPGGTAGGIKLTTFVVMIATVLATVRGQSDVVLFNLKRRVSEEIVRKALAVFLLSLTLVLVMTILIVAIEPFSLMDVLFEVVSAFGTVGLSTGITGSLTPASKLLISLTMLAGRVGMLPFMLAIFTGRRTSVIRYSEEPLLLG